MAGGLSAAQRARVRRLSQPHELSPDEEGGELNIVPFLDIIVNILIFVLATVAVTFTATIDTNPPASGGGGIINNKDDSLNLTVFVTNDGFSLKAVGGNVGPGCEGVGAGLAIPKKNNRYDFDGLTACAVKLKGLSDKFRDETQVGVAANPGTEYQLIISTIDALRSTPQGDSLFPDVNFKVPK